MSYQMSTGRGILFLNDQKTDQSGLLSGGTTHNTQSDIKMGVVAVDQRYYGYELFFANFTLTWRWFLIGKIARKRQ